MGGKHKCALRNALAEAYFFDVSLASSMTLVPRCVNSMSPANRCYASAWVTATIGPRRAMKAAHGDPRESVVHDPAATRMHQGAPGDDHDSTWSRRSFPADAPLVYLWGKAGTPAGDNGTAQML
jgi:hypothetical protein